MFLILNKYYAGKFSETTGIKIQSQHWGDKRKLSIEVINFEYFPNILNISRNKLKSEFHSYISGDNKQDYCEPHANIVHLFKNSLNQDFKFLGC